MIVLPTVGVLFSQTQMFMDLPSICCIKPLIQRSSEGKNKHFCRSFHSYVSLPEGKPSTYWDTPMETYGSYRSFQVFPHFSASKTTTPTPCVSPGLEVLGVLPQLVFQLSGPGHWRNQTSHMTYQISIKTIKYQLYFHQILLCYLEYIYIYN